MEGNGGEAGLNGESRVQRRRQEPLRTSAVGQNHDFPTAQNSFPKPSASIRWRRGPFLSSIVLRGSLILRRESLDRRRFRRGHKHARCGSGFPEPRTGCRETDGERASMRLDGVVGQFPGAVVDAVVDCRRPRGFRLMNAGRMTRSTTAALSERGYNFARAGSTPLSTSRPRPVSPSSERRRIHLDAYFSSNNQN